MVDRETLGLVLPGEKYSQAASPGFLLRGRVVRVGPLRPGLHRQRIARLATNFDQGVMKGEIINRCLNERIFGVAALPGQQMVVGLVSLGPMKAARIDDPVEGDLFQLWRDNERRLRRCLTRAGERCTAPQEADDAQKGSVQFPCCSPALHTREILPICVRHASHASTA